MSSRVGPFAYISEPSRLARRLGVSWDYVTATRDQVVSGNGYDYRSVRIHGKARNIAVPRPPVKALQQRIHYFLWPLNHELHDCCYGYRPGRSTVGNAREHCGNRWVQRLDIEDFYPSTSSDRIVQALVAWRASESVARLIAQLTSDQGCLPLGAPTSPIIGNLILHPVDSVLAVEAKKIGLVYTRYADDLTFSGGLPFDMTERVESALLPLEYELNSGKAQIRQRGQRIVVTGLTVAEPDRPRLPKQFERRLRQELYFIEKFGLEDHCANEYLWPFIDEDNEDRQFEHSVNHLRGKIRYAMGVEPEWMIAMSRRCPDAWSELGPDGSGRERAESFRKVATAIRERSPVPLTTTARPIAASTS